MLNVKYLLAYEYYDVQDKKETHRAYIKKKKKDYWNICKYSEKENDYTYISLAFPGQLPTKRLFSMKECESLYDSFITM